jgi:hypothetical protein
MGVRKGLDALQHTPMMPHCNKNHKGAQGAFRNL